MTMPCISGLHSTATGGEKRHLFTTLPIFPMLVPQGSKPSLFGGRPLILLERLANCASSDLSVFVVPVVFVFLTIRTLQHIKFKERQYVKN
jgi:hypothetical protein